MVWLQAVLLYVHILGAIFWFGSSLFLQFLMVPALRSMQFEAQKPWMVSISSRYGKVIGPIGGLTILFGLARGIATGVLSNLGSAYGLTFIASIVASIFVAAMGGAFIGRTAEKMSQSTTREAVLESLVKISSYGRIEVSGFLVLLALMVAMRAGY